MYIEVFYNFKSNRNVALSAERIMGKETFSCVLNVWVFYVLIRFPMLSLWVSYLSSIMCTIALNPACRDFV